MSILHERIDCKQLDIHGHDCATLLTFDVVHMVLLVLPMEKVRKMNVGFRLSINRIMIDTVCWRQNDK